MSIVSKTLAGICLAMLFFNASAMAVQQNPPLEANGSNQSVSLRWPRYTDGTFLRYRIYMDTQSDYSTVVQVDSTTSFNNLDTTKTLSPLTNYIRLYFRVVWVDTFNVEHAFLLDASAVPTTFIPVAGLPFLQLHSGDFLWGDYDNDGDYDVFITGSTTDEWNNGPYEQGRARLYRNDLGTFTEVNAGFQEQIHRTAAAWCDYNNDGLLDISYMGSSGNGTRAFKLYKNNGNGTFSDVPTDIAGQAFGAIAWGDYDNDGDQDVIIVGNDGNSDNTLLYRNDGNGAFTQVDIGLPGYSGGSVAWGDYDNDHDLDLLILGNGTVEIYRNDNDGQFTELLGEGPLFYGVNRGQAIWADYDNDGFLDVIYSGASGEGRFAAVYRNEGGDLFGDIGASLTAVARSTVSAGDFDNDGDLDFFFAGDPQTDYT
ncbi:VCBS repeat-containing protein, partial [Candidatus Saccharibacteria bacterium]|nr:VCBS repeat-containing protein [Candidatus Saccharibacteria bacterium]